MRSRGGTRPRSTHITMSGARPPTTHAPASFQRRHMRLEAGQRHVVSGRLLVTHNRCGVGAPAAGGRHGQRRLCGALCSLLLCCRCRLPRTRGGSRSALEEGRSVWLCVGPFCPPITPLIYQPVNHASFALHVFETGLDAVAAARSKANACARFRRACSRSAPRCGTRRVAALSVSSVHAANHSTHICTASFLRDCIDFEHLHRFYLRQSLHIAREPHKGVPKLAAAVRCSISGNSKSSSSGDESSSSSPRARADESRRDSAATPVHGTAHGSLTGEREPKRAALRERARARVLPAAPTLHRCKTAASPAHLQTHTPRPDAVANHIAQPPGPRPQQPEPRQPRRRRRRKRRRRRAQQRRRRRQLHVRQDRSGAARGALRVRDEPLPLGVARALRALVPLRRRAPRRARARAVRGARSGFFCL